MKIIHVENYFDPKAGYQINELLYASKDFNDDVYLITSKDMQRFHKTYKPGMDDEFEKKTGVKIIRLNTLFKYSSRIILKNLQKTINSISPDVLFMHGIGDFRDLTLWRKKKEYKIIRDCHMSWIASKNKLKNLFYLLYRVFFSTIINRTDKYEKVYALGIEEYEYLKKLGIRDDKIDFMLHGYNNEVMYYNDIERTETRNEYSFNSNDIIISYIGKFNYYKQPHLLLNIIKLIDKNYLADNNVKLLLIGPKEKEYMHFFEEELKKFDERTPVIIDEAKEFNELRKYFSSSDICIFPKETSLSSIHAQVCLSPVIMEDHKSNQERVIDNNNLYPINNLEKASTILKDIIDNKEYKKDGNYNIIIEEREYKNQVRKISKMSETIR